MKIPKDPTPQSNSSRISRFIIETRLLYALLIVMGTILGSLYDNVKDINRNRAIDNATTIKTICERQEFAIGKIVDTKKRLAHTNKDVSVNTKTLRDLIQGVIPFAEKEAKKPLRKALENLERTLTSLRQNNSILREGRATLELELARINCAKLPSVDPFGGETATEGEATIKEKEK